MLAGGVEVVELEHDLAAGQQQLRILVVPGVGQEALGARHLVAAERRFGQAQRHLGVAGIELDDLLEQLLGLARRASPVELLGQRSTSAVTALPMRTRIASWSLASKSVGSSSASRIDERIGAVLIAARLALVDRRLQVALGVGQRALLGEASTSCSSAPSCSASSLRTLL